MNSRIAPRALLESSGRKHKWVAKQMGIGSSYLSHLVAGRRRWTDELRKAFALGVGLDEQAIDFARRPTTSSDQDGQNGSPKSPQTHGEATF